jgi:hypothetical protein
METEIIDKLFLELSQVTQARTGRELNLASELLMAEERAQKWRDELRQVLAERDAAIARAEAAEREVERLLAEMLAAQWKRGDIERDTAEAIAAWLDSFPLLPSDSPRLELERAAWGEAFAADIRAGAWRKEPK